MKYDIEDLYELHYLSNDDDDSDDLYEEYVLNEKNKSSSAVNFIEIISNLSEKEEVRIEKDIQDVCNELKLTEPDKTVISQQAKQYASYSTDLKLIFNYSDIKHFMSESDKYRLNIIRSFKKLVEKKFVSKEPYVFRVMNSGLDLYAKQIVLNKVNQLLNMRVGQGDYYKLKRWVDTTLSMPWGNYKSINVKSNKIPDYLTKSRSILDNVIYGQDESKDIIIQIISKLITNTNSGNVFSLYGPAGVGKTTIIKNGLAKALNLPFAFISLGGATDASYLDGHSYTYEGSIAGKIVDIVSKAGCMNPIIYFDELDKVSNTAKGREITNMLIHLTDPVQSSMFQDKYLGNIDIDLSRCIFVFSFNNIEKVNKILLDRMKLIYVKGFTIPEKMVITRDYLLPDLLKEYNLYISGYKNENGGNLNKVLAKNLSKTTPILDLDDSNLKFIINFGETNGSHLNNKEEGVRQIKQRIEKLCSLINIVKLTKGKWKKPVHSILDNIPELSINEDKYPIKLSNNTIEKLLKIKNLENSAPPFGMYC